MAYTYTRQRDKVVKDTAKKLDLPPEKVEEIVKTVEEATVLVPNKPEVSEPVKEQEEEPIVAETTINRDEQAHEHVHGLDPQFVEAESEIGMSEAWAVNNKHMFDAYLQRDLLSLDRNQHHFDSDVAQARRQQDILFNDARVQMQTLFNLNVQMMQTSIANMDAMAKQNMRHADNTIETSEMVGKQAVRHADIAIEHHWEVPEAIRVAAVGDVIRDTAKDVAETVAIANAVNKD